MPFYESTFIVRQDASPQEVDKLVKNFSDVVKARGGQVVKHELWGLRNLAYKINKYRKGWYVLLYLDAPADAVNELQRQYKLNESIMRNLTVSVEKISEEVSPMLRKDEAAEVEEVTEKRRSNG